MGIDLSTDSQFMSESRTDRASDGGFTLIELMVVVLIIAILLAIAIPMFLGARKRANDRAAQSNVRNAHTTELIVYADVQQFTEDINTISEVDPSLTYSQSLPEVASGQKKIFVEVPAAGTSSPFDTVLLASKSKGGSCFWIRTIGDQNHPRFAENDCSATPAACVDEW